MQTVETPTRRRTILIRALFVAAVVPLTIGANYCEKTRPAPVRLRTVEPARTEALLDQVNELSNIKSIEARSVTIDFEDLAGIEQGKKRQIPTVYGIMILERPQKIRLRLQAPVVKSNVADMVSDGQHFKIAIFYPDSSRGFLTGSNSVAYHKMSSDSSNNPDVKRAGALKNVRPQHLIEALLVDPINLAEPDLISFREEENQIEADTRPNHLKDAQVEKTYAVLTVLRKTDSQPAVLLKKFWFDQTVAGVPLTRQQVYDDLGRIVADIRYVGFFKADDTHLPRRIIIHRRMDGYTITLQLDPDTTRLNVPVAPTAFELENSDGLPVVDLDRRVQNQ